jgi:hypothetical protein
MKSEVSLKLKGRHAFLMGANRIERLDPLSKGDMGAVHYRSNRHRKLTPASIALNETIPYLVGFGLNPGHVFAFTVGALNSFGPTDIFKDCPRFVLRHAANINGGHVI